MLVIEGRSGKIKELAKELDGVLEDVLFINSSDISNPFASFRYPVCYIETNNDSLYKTVGRILSNTEAYRHFRIIVFYANCGIDEIQYVKLLETKLKNRCIVTVQNNDLEEIRRYEV